MPCNAIIQQAAQLSLNPALITKHPAVIQLLADRIANLLANPVAVCPVNDWATTYLAGSYTGLHQDRPIDQLDLTSGVMFFSRQCAIAVYPDGRVQLRDGQFIGQRPANPDQLLQQITALIQTTAGLVLQQLVMAQVATIAQLVDSQTAPNGALVLNINA
jgi:hypothetical protein